MVQKLRILLLPFGLMYGTVMHIRNFLYSNNILKSYKIPIPSIIVGNLSTGGTGKTPHVELLVKLLSEKYKIAILSRGYGRKTKGYIELNEKHNYLDVGDEPLQYFQKFGSLVTVVVCENRKIGVENLLLAHPEIEVLLLDDALQHRKVKGGFTILLSEFNNPFFRDLVLPGGNLREFRMGKKRADICIYTKSPSEISVIDEVLYSRKFSDSQTKNTYFSSINYGEIASMTKTKESTIKDVLLITGIANPSPLEDYLNHKYNVESIHFSDHHSFNLEEMEEIHKIFDNFARESKIILTTEKDMIRLQGKNFSEAMADYPWYYIPIQIDINKEEQFKQEIFNYVEKARRNNRLHSK